MQTNTASREVLHPRYAPLDLSAPLRTRDGRAVRLLSADSPQQIGPYTYPILAEVEHPNAPGEWVRWHFLRCGHWKSNDACNHNDLVRTSPAAPFIDHPPRLPLPIHPRDQHTHSGEDR